MSGGRDIRDEDFELVGVWSEAEGPAGAVAFIRDREGRALLQLRDSWADRAPDVWGFFGGGVEPGEALDECLVRELEEEIGITADPARLRPLVRTFRPMSGVKLYVFELLDPVAPGEIVLGEGAGFAFVTKANYARLELLDFVRAYLDEWAASSA